MKLTELNKELEKALSNYAYEVQTITISDKEVLENEDIRPLLNLIDEMNRCNYYTMQHMKDNVIKYLEEKEGN